MSGEAVNILSDEHLSFGSAPIKEVFERLASVAPDMEIIVVIRNQTDLLRSWYDMSPVLGGPGGWRYVNFQTWLDWALSGEFLVANKMFYADEIEAARAVFGASRVHVFTFEGLFVKRAERGALAALLGLEECEVSALLDSSRENNAESHAARKLARRMLGPVHASWFLPRGIRLWLMARAAGFVSNRRTLIPETCYKRVEAFYGDQYYQVQSSESRWESYLEAFGGLTFALGPKETGRS
ncbi:MAG: hypothetical protein QNJ35_13570 [Paracoccaceae bacterium]|nr:hypothetical protein [Paracoccaceae bacterium]